MHSTSAGVLPIDILQHGGSSAASLVIDQQLPTSSGDNFTSQGVLTCSSAPAVTPVLLTATSTPVAPGSSLFILFYLLRPYILEAF